jgi:predicted transcriptional regulator
MKTLAIRLEDDIHAQLSVLAQLEELTVTDAIRQAIASFVAAKRSNPELTARAEAVLADIERDAASRRDAIASLFDPEQVSNQASSPPGADTTAAKPAAPGTRSTGGRPPTG